MKVQTVAICTDVVSVSFRVLHTAAEMFIINMLIFIPLKLVRVLAWMGQDYTWGSVHVAVWKLNIPNHTKLPFFPILLKLKTPKS